MLNFSSFSILFFLPNFLFFSIIWYAYFLVNYTAHVKFTSKSDAVKLKNKSIVFNSASILNFNFIQLISSFLILYFFTLRGYEDFYFFRHLFLSNFTFSLFFYVVIISFILYSLFFKIIKSGSKGNVSSDYLISIVHIFFFLPYAFFSNTILTVFFFLELASNLVLYNLISSNNWFNLSKLNNKKQGSSSTVSKYFFNVIFFHFWASFFSSILILYSIINFYLYFGTSEWFYLNFLIGLLLKGTYTTNLLFIYLNLLIFFLAFTIKLGISPFFIFKLEIYKGLPLYNVFFYSTVFFLIFFTLFFLVLFYYLPILTLTLKFFLLLIILVSVILVVFFIFDNILLRNFFALSSLINSLNLLILIV